MHGQKNIKTIHKGFDPFSKRDWTPLRSTKRWELNMFVAGHVQLYDAITVVNKSAD
jgi:hypothetical protein